MAMLEGNITRDQIRKQGDKVASMLRAASKQSFTPSLQDTGNALLAAQSVQNTRGANPYEAYTGSMDKAKQTQMDQTKMGVDAEATIMDLMSKIKQSGDADAMAVGAQLEKYPPDAALKLFQAMSEDPEEVNASNAATKAAVIANKLGIQPLSYAEHKAKIEKIKLEAEGLGGATGYNVRQMQRENPGSSFTENLYKYQTGWRQGMQYNPEIDQMEPIPGAAGAKGALKQGETEGGERGKLTVEREKNKTKAQNALKAYKRKADTVVSTVDKALQNIYPGKSIDAILKDDGKLEPSGWSTGWGSYLFSGMPNTEAKALVNYLDTIKANLGFDSLQEMRDNSPTGGALGQVSEMENRLLQAVNGALDPEQGDQLGENLKIIRELYPQVMAEREAAYKQDYEGGGQQSTPQMAPISGMGNAQPKQAPDGSYYIPDPNRPGKYLKVEP